MRKIDKIVIHCSDSPHDDQHDNVQSIKQWHVKENGWKDIGYHAVITKANNGKIHHCRFIGVVGSHVKGHNKNSIGICLTGRFHFSEQQIESLIKICCDYCQIFDLKVSDIVGHYELLTDNGKTCPNIDMQAIRFQIKKRLEQGDHLC